MIARFARGYARFLIALGMLLFTLSVLFHLGFLIGIKGPFSEYGLMLFAGSIATSITTTSFQKNKMSWKNETKNCPRWMRRTFNLLAIYAIVVIGIQIFIFPSGDTFSDTALAVSTVPLCLNALSVCVIYSVIWSGTVDESDLIKRTRNSLIMMMTSGAALFLFFLGYLRHPWVR